ncbi:MAG: dCTP deaminase [Acidobacteriaceae bacterium]
MRLLVDKELIALIRDEGAVESVPTPRDWYAADSPVQPASLDLHVGEIFIPGKRPSASGGRDNPEDEIVLRTGHTVVVTTLESLKLPSDVSGIGFPPSHVSELGLLMTNPGHIDPGYDGRLRFVVINVGKGDFPLRCGDPIVTLLLFRSECTPVMDWRERNPISKPTRPSQSRINRLCRDFVDLESRTRKLIFHTALFASAISGILAIFLTLGTNLAIERMNRLQNMRDDISVLKAQLKTVEQRINQTTTQPSSPTNATAAQRRK